MEAATWIIGILFVLMLIAAIIFLILWLSKNNASKNSKSELAITGLKFSLVEPGNTSVTASWTSTGNVNDEIMMYASSENINFDSGGVPEKNTKAILQAGPVASSAKTITIPGLTPNTLYYVVLVVTNKAFPNSFNPEPTNVFTSGVPPTDFIISEITTDGAITLSNTNTVNYVPGTNKFDTSDLWKYDRTNFTLTGTTLGASSGQEVVLYNNNGVLAADVSTSSNINSTNSQWTYNINGNNRWCLKNVENTCMHLDTPISGTTPIHVLVNTTTKWKNIPQPIANTFS